MNASWVADQTAFRSRLGIGPRGTRQETVLGGTARPIGTEPAPQTRSARRPRGGHQDCRSSLAERNAPPPARHGSPSSSRQPQAAVPCPDGTISGSPGPRPARAGSVTPTGSSARRGRGAGVSSSTYAAKREPELGATFRRCPRPDRAAHRGHELAADEQPDPCAWRGHALRRPEVEPEQLVGLLGREPGTVVADGDAHPRRRRTLTSHEDARVVSRVLHGVRQQVAHDLGEVFLVRRDTSGPDRRSRA